jgi:hypothetical protein
MLTRVAKKQGEKPCRRKPQVSCSQVNLLNIIPLYRRTIHFIQSALEEEERNTLFQVKVLRERQERQAAH